MSWCGVRLIKIAKPDKKNAVAKTHCIFSIWRNNYTLPGYRKRLRTVILIPRMQTSRRYEFMGVNPPSFPSIPPHSNAPLYLYGCHNEKLHCRVIELRTAESVRRHHWVTVAEASVCQRWTCMITLGYSSVTCGWRDQCGVRVFVAEIRSMFGLGSVGIAAILSACQHVRYSAVILSSEVVSGHSSTLCGQVQCRPGRGVDVDSLPIAHADIWISQVRTTGGSLPSSR